MKNKESKPVFKLWETILIAFVSSLIMSTSTGYLVYTSNKVPKNNNSKELNELITSYNNIVNNYYDEIDQNALVDAAINGMLKYLGDPYTTYLNENNTNLLNDSLNGSYEGIGVEVTENDNGEIIIVKVFDESPALRVGLQAGDIIIKVDDTDLTDKDHYDAVEAIKNNKSGEIKLTVKRKDEVKEFVVNKTTLYVPAVYKEIFNINDKRIGYILIDKFSDTVFEQFHRELVSLEESKIDSIIIDLRNNTGGYLTGATSIAELFIQKGKIIYSLESKLSKEDTLDETDEYRSYPMMVLINKGSASAAEVLAAAFKYSYNATLVGVKTYGKGKVQRTTQLNDGTMYKYTSAKWLTPKGDCVDEVGLAPDIEVNLSEEYAKNPSFENDNQVQTAIYELSK